MSCRSFCDEFVQDGEALRPVFTVDHELGDGLYGLEYLNIIGRDLLSADQNNQAVMSIDTNIFDQVDEKTGTPYKVEAATRTDSPTILTFPLPKWLSHYSNQIIMAKVLQKLEAQGLLKNLNGLQTTVTGSGPVSLGGKSNTDRIGVGGSSVERLASARPRRNCRSKHI